MDDYEHYHGNHHSNLVLSVQVPGFKALVRRRHALAHRDYRRSYGYPYPLRYIKIHVLMQGSHREGPGIRFPTTSGVNFPFSGLLALAPSARNQ